MSGYFGSSEHGISTVLSFVYLDAWTLDGFCVSFNARVFDFFFRNSSNFWQQIFRVSGFDGFFFRVFKARGLRQVYGFLDMTFSTSLKPPEYEFTVCSSDLDALDLDS
ncbi:hypothetical protein RCL_jg9373.t1 [Rhizophagus clarus]|uniref:Uncharacterized protein n=1 Tax=Rhizophagus clarus TaxID=94130 RepID=A0A8H3R0X1_9GLOM|nr:hypothetical protein RCL_jg9373.t1 [Rhizophagus clarus]